MVRRTRHGISKFRVRVGACHRAAFLGGPVGTPRNDLAVRQPVTFTSSGTAGSYFELCSTSDVLTLRTCGAAVRWLTKSWNVAMSGAELLERAQVRVGLAGQMHRGEHRDVETETAGVQQSAITLDIAGLLERPHPAQAGRRRNADAFGQFNVGDSAVGLDFAEDFEVNLVKILRHAGPGPGANKSLRMVIGNSLSATGGTSAILLRVRRVIFPLAGKIRRYGLQFLHSLPDIGLGFGTFGAAAMPFRAHPA